MRRARRSSLSGFGDTFGGPEIAATLAAAGLVAYLLWPKKARAATSAQPLPAPDKGKTETPSQQVPMPDNLFPDAGPTTPIAPPPPAAADATKTVEKGEAWSSIAKRAYGDYRWWPYLWDHNSSLSTQFPDPDVLRRGDTIRIPPAPPADAAYKAAIFARTALHQAYWRCRSAGNTSCVLDARVLERTPVPTQSVAGLGCGSRMSGLGYRSCGCR